jgi:hypothetical protein
VRNQHDIDEAQKVLAEIAKLSGTAKENKN